jgi:hypothetical protein
MHTFAISLQLTCCVLCCCCCACFPLRFPVHRFIDHGRYEDQIAEAGLSASHIASTALSVLGKPKDAQLTLSGISV